jgi:hypothetical protein
MAATGGDASAESTAKLFAALRVLDVEVLALGHVPKTQADGSEYASVYGSVFNQNFARAVWEIKKEQAIGEDGSVLGLFNRKTNLSRPHLPIGLSVTQNSESTCIRYVPCDLNQASELAASLPLPNRIRNLLEDGTVRTARQVADELGAKLTSVKSVLSRHQGHKWMMLGGSGQETTWTVLRTK